MFSISDVTVTMPFCDLSKHLTKCYMAFSVNELNCKHSGGGGLSMLFSHLFTTHYGKVPSGILASL